MSPSRADPLTRNCEAPSLDKWLTINSLSELSRIHFLLIKLLINQLLVSAMLDRSWWFVKKILQMDFLLNMHECVLISLPSEWKEALLAGCERRDRRNNRGQILMKTLWEHRWRETAPRRLMCGWVTATSGAGLTQPISRRDTSASLQRQTTISMNDWA